MKKFITNYWKRILLVIGGAVALFLLVYKIAAPKTIIDDYVKYGKVIESTDGGKNITDIIVRDEDKLFNFDNIDPELIRLAIILIIGILFVVILNALASKAGEKKDAAKKK